MLRRTSVDCFSEKGLSDNIYIYKCFLEFIIAIMLATPICDICVVVSKKKEQQQTYSNETYVLED
ncbi:hypothetical protein GQX74_000820 [Glossina fuscipes]|nr:hypothetical protein GQX74_000820 [Glossina fuscipes]